MVIGLDLDNTIICYDTIFHKIALEEGLIESAIPRKKNAVRDDMRSRGLEPEWTRLQGVVYGYRILEAEVFDGVEEFCQRANEQNHRLVIISHKTRYPYLGEKIDLHEAARNLIFEKGFVTKSWIDEKDIYFELTKAEKVARIAQVGCDVFVDDLPEIFEMQEFPERIKKILFDPEKKWIEKKGLLDLAHTWYDIAELILHK